MVTEVGEVVAISDTTANRVREFARTSGRENLQVGSFQLGTDFASDRTDTPFHEEGNQGADSSRPVNFLMVGTIEPRKGHHQVLKAFELLWKSGIDWKLTILGKQGWQVENVMQKIEELGRFGHIEWRGYVTEEELAEAYRDCTALIGASIDEGFGLPLLEAMSFQKPVIARNIEIFREVTANQAFFFRSTDGLGLAQEIREWVELYRSGKIPMASIPATTWDASYLSFLDAVSSVLDIKITKDLD
jgi:glycosyltransferase involved in cell wall biosynthesis